MISVNPRSDSYSDNSTPAYSNSARPMPVSDQAPELKQLEGQGMAAAGVVSEGEEGLYCLDNGLRVQRASSCALVPEPGDRVLMFWQPDSAKAGYILHVLERGSSDTARISIPNCEVVDIQQKTLRLSAGKELSLACARDISLTSVAGAIRFKAQQWVSSILGAMVETARERISRAEFTQINSSMLTQLHSKQAIVTADEDIKVDAERVNLG